MNMFCLFSTFEAMQITISLSSFSVKVLFLRLTSWLQWSLANVITSRDIYYWIWSKHLFVLLQSFQICPHLGPADFRIHLMQPIWTRILTM